MIYAPFGSVNIEAENINLNGIIIVASEVKIKGTTVNINSLSIFEDKICNSSYVIDIQIEDEGYGISLLAMSEDEIYSRVISIEDFRDETEVIIGM